MEIFKEPQTVTVPVDLQVEIFTSGVWESTNLLQNDWVAVVVTIKAAEHDKWSLGMRRSEYEKFEDLRTLAWYVLDYGERGGTILTYTGQSK